MKQTKKTTRSFATALLAVTLPALCIALCAASCVSAVPAVPAAGGQTSQEPGQEPRDESGITIAAIETKVLDWQGRTARAPAQPQWIQDIQSNAFDNAASTLSERDIGNSVYRGLTISGPDLRGAQMRTDLNFARTIARELQQSINVFLASSTNGMSDATTEAMKELTQTQSKVEISGARQVAEFWQTVESVDPSNNRKTRETILYRLYAFNRDDWVALTAGYVQRVLDTLPPRLRPEEKDVLDMMQNMVNDARHPVQMSQQEQEMQLAAQERMLRVQEGLAPEAARQAAQLELAKLQAETSVTLNAQNNQAATQQVGQVAQAAAAISQSNAERAAYASGDPVLRAAAATTIEDRPLVDASRLASRLKF